MPASAVSDSLQTATLKTWAGVGMLDVDELGALLNLSGRQVRERVASGELPAPDQRPGAGRNCGFGWLVPTVLRWQASVSTNGEQGGAR